MQLECTQYLQAVFQFFSIYFPIFQYFVAMLAQYAVARGPVWYPRLQGYVFGNEEMGNGEMVVICLFLVYSYYCALMFSLSPAG